MRLYHLADDPQETVDLASRPEHATRLRSLLARLTALQLRLGDTVDLTAVSP